MISSQSYDASCKCATPKAILMSDQMKGSKENSNQNEAQFEGAKYRALSLKRG